MFEFSLQTQSKCWFSFLVPMPTLIYWWQPAWGWLEPFWHMPIPILAPSLLWIPFKPNLYEAGSLEYLEFGPLILFWTRLKTRSSSDSWGPWQKYPPSPLLGCYVQNLSGSIQLCWWLELLFPCILSLPFVTVYNSLMVWFTSKHYSAEQQGGIWGYDSKYRERRYRHRISLFIQVISG